MRLRLSLALPPLALALTLGTLAPAQAAPTDPVTDLAVTVVQKPGTNDSWHVSASWTANPDATGYSVLIADHSDGSVTPGKAYGNKDTSSTTATITSSNLSEGVDYWIVVRTAAPATGDVAVEQFTPPALDTTAPAGTYRLSRTTAFLNPLGEGDGGATFTITQTSVDAGTVNRKVLAGDGSAAKPWTSSGGFSLTYSAPGTFTPAVVLSDEFGNERTITLPSVLVRVDNIAPTVRITRPAKPTKASSWRVIRGTSSDVGNGVIVIGTFVAEKRGKKWWTYDFRKRRWLAGTASLKKSIAKSKANPAFTSPGRSGAWKTPAIKGLTKGTLHIEAIAIDADFNLRLVKLDQKVR